MVLIVFGGVCALARGTSRRLVIATNQKALFLIVRPLKISGYPDQPVGIGFAADTLKRQLRRVLGYGLGKRREKVCTISAICSNFIQNSPTTRAMHIHADVVLSPSTRGFSGLENIWCHLAICKWQSNEPARVSQNN
jgi:hypothetical protein